MMRTIVKFIVRGLVELFNVALSFAKIAIFSKPPPSLVKYSSGLPECVILGDAPSLKNTLTEHRDFLHNKTVFCTNNFASSPDFTNIKPSYYVFADPAFWETKLSDRLASTLKNYHETLKKVAWPMVIFFPVAARATSFCRDLPALNPNITTVYFNSTEINCFRRLRYFLYKKNLAIPIMQNVLVAAIFLTINMGFKKVYLTGADHSWHETLQVGDDNIVYLKNNRQDIQGANLAPFFVDGEERTPFRMDNLFWALSRMYTGYRELNAYAQYMGAKIYNASQKSYIDAFERFNLDRV